MSYIAVSYIGQLLDLIDDPLLAVLVALAGGMVLSTQECTSYAAIDKVIISRIGEADQSAAGLGHGVAPVGGGGHG